ncbi:hypothetical protein [Microbispora amethystogenes]|uniref:Uncharacterized protein n=1 Tax=Microbispora amethystogenes TaxID=1427754 RepID=A0ABQ4F6K1_9ACTN|nr:hypothetical protein [Microbispora amethystogenes]GIH30435.1 hypothetical protein Mam01_05990 [Microbispora amethystogenes]
MTYLTASRPPSREESAARQVDAHLAATHNIRGGQIRTYRGVALLRLGDVSVWFRAGKISWSTGELGTDGKPKAAALLLHETAQAAAKIAQRYRELRGRVGLHAVRIG